MAMPWLTPQLINRLEALQLSVRSVRAGSAWGGRFPVNRRGSSIEFADYLPYAAGDDIRAIDWKLYARLDKLYVKTYKEEISLSVEVLIDATQSMALPEPAKFERAQRLAVCLGYVALADRHRVRLSSVGPGTPQPSPWLDGRRDVFRLMDQVQAIRPGGQTELSEWMRRAAVTRRMQGGQAIFITDGMLRQADFFRAMNVLLVRHMEVKVVQVLTPQELHPGQAVRAGMIVDSETGQTHQLAYGPEELDRAVADHNESLARFCKRHGILFVRYRTDEPFDTFVTKTLPAYRFLE